MNRNRFLAIAAALLALVVSAPAQVTTWQIDPVHSFAQFSVRHMMVSNVRGEFTKCTGTIQLDPKDITQSTLEATLDATTINTREAKRDAHLKSPDFFDVAQFPTLTFKSKKITRNGKDGLQVIGDLTIHGVTREVTLDVEGPTPPQKDPGGNLRIGASGRTKVNRKDFGLNWNRALDAGGVLVGDDVTITLDVELVNKKAS